MDTNKETLDKLFGPNVRGQFERNIKCVPQDPKWPKDRAMLTNDFGMFYPGQVKKVPLNAASIRLVENGDFVFTDDPENPKQISEQVETVKREFAANRAKAKADKKKPEAPKDPEPPKDPVT